MQQISNSSLNYNYYYEIPLRVIIFILHFWINKAAAFVREIKPNEQWLYQYPQTVNYVSHSNLWLFVIISPTIVLCIDYIVHKNVNDVIRGSLTCTLSCGLTAILTSLIKIMVGRPRPDFYTRCFPNGDGTDFNQCTGDWHAVNNGRKSFPSGHSSLSLCSGVFVTLYLIRRFKLFSIRQSGGKSWKLCILILPILSAVIIAISRTCDYHHHYEDVIAGSLLGSVMSYIVFKMYFNHTIERHCNCLKKKTKNCDK